MAKRKDLPKSADVEVLTPEECGILWRNLKNQWLDRGDDYDKARKIVQRLYRRWIGQDRKEKVINKVDENVQ